MIYILGEHGTVTGSSIKHSISVYRQLRWCQITHIRISQSNHLDISLRRHIHTILIHHHRIIMSLRISVMGRIYLHHLPITLSIHLPSYYLDIINDCMNKIIGKCLGLSITSSSSTSDSVRCACMLIHPPRVRTSGYYSTRLDMRIPDTIFPHESSLQLIYKLCSFVSLQSCHFDL